MSLSVSGQTIQLLNTRPWYKGYRRRKKKKKKRLEISRYEIWIPNIIYTIGIQLLAFFSMNSHSHWNALKRDFRIEITSNSHPHPRHTPILYSKLMMIKNMCRVKIPRNSNHRKRKNIKLEVIMRRILWAKVSKYKYIYMYVYCICECRTKHIFAFNPILFVYSLLCIYHRFTIQDFFLFFSRPTPHLTLVDEIFRFTANHSNVMYRTYRANEIISTQKPKNKYWNKLDGNESGKINEIVTTNAKRHTLHINLIKLTVFLAFFLNVSSVLWASNNLTWGYGIKNRNLFRTHVEKKICSNPCG